MKGEHGRGILLAVVAGMMAALASTSAKLAMTAEAVHHICSDIAQRFSSSNSERETEFHTILCDSVSMRAVDWLLGWW